MTSEFPALYHSHSREPPTQLCSVTVADHVMDWRQGDINERRSPYVVNGVAIAPSIEGCCMNDPCSCRSDVIFYNGQAYDQKPFIDGRFRTRPNNVMFFEGRLTPPFNPGKPISTYGPYRSRGKPPKSQCFNDTKYGRRLHPCCASSYDNVKDQAFGRAGLPYGETIGFFRFKPNKICDCRLQPVQRLGECCTCEPGEYNPAQYMQNDCPERSCCC